MNKSFNVIALNESYTIVSLLRYTNLQWSRKYYEPGTFSIQIPLDQYNPDIAYIYTKDRPEMGYVEQINYIAAKGYQYVQLSGHFLENELNYMYLYGSDSRFLAPHSDDPPMEIGFLYNAIYNGLFYNGNIEDVVTSMVHTYKEIDIAKTEFYNYGTVSSDEYHIIKLNVSEATSQQRGKTITGWLALSGKKLGKTCYELLMDSELSYRIVFDYDNTTATFTVVNGIDRTVDQSTNNPIIFSTKYGNVKNPNILIDKSNYCEYAIVENKYTSSGVEMVEYQAAIRNNSESTTSMYGKGSTFLSTNINPDSCTDYHATLAEMGAQELTDKHVIINLEFDAIEGSYEYMTDFDLGDKCSIEVPELGISASSRIIGCYEVIKSGVWTMTMEFGEPLIKKF